MASPTIADILGAYNVRDFGAFGDGNNDDSPEITAAMRHVAQQSRANGMLFFPPGTYRVDSLITHTSGIHIIGAGSVSIIKLGPGQNANLWQFADDAVDVRMTDIKLDGNRANNTDGNGVGLYGLRVIDGWLENVEVVSCRADGIQLHGCERVEGRGVKASDNGRHGVSFNYSTFCQWFATRAYNNSQVVAAGAGDGINLDVLSTDNTFIGPLCYDSALTGSRQGYGLQEVAGSGCARNLVVGITGRGNLTALLQLDADSLALYYNMLLTGAGFGVGTQSPNASALLDLVSTRQGFGLPVMTTAQMNGIVSPRAGLVVYDSTANKIKFYTGSAWETVSSA